MLGGEQASPGRAHRGRSSRPGSPSGAYRADGLAFTPLSQSSKTRGGAFTFAIAFLALVVSFRWLVSLDVADRFLHEPLCALIAWLSAAVLSPFGDASVRGTFVSFDGFRVVVVDACNGVLPATIYLAAVLAFPTSWRARLWGVLIGLPSIFVFNLVRVASLLVLGAYWPAVFEEVHIYVWQTLVIALSMGVWIFWAEHFVRPETRLAPSA